jgi:hypothetical protein
MLRTWWQARGASSLKKTWSWVKIMRPEDVRCR